MNVCIKMCFKKNSSTKNCYSPLFYHVKSNCHVRVWAKINWYRVDSARIIEDDFLNIYLIRDPQRMNTVKVKLIS